MSHLLKAKRGHDSDDEDYSGTDVSTDDDLDYTDEDDVNDDDYTDDVNDDDYTDDEDDKDNADEGSDEAVVIPKGKEVVNYQDLDTSLEKAKEKRIQEQRDYRRKLAEDPSFVPYVGLFWGHDDRYRGDSLTETRPVSESVPHFSSSTNNSMKKDSYDRNLDPLMYKKWDHSGYEELLRMDEEDERQRQALIAAGELDENAEYKPNRNYHRQNTSRGRGYRQRGGHQPHYQHRPRQQYQKQEEWPELTSKLTTGNAQTTSWGQVESNTSQADKSWAESSTSHAPQQAEPSTAQAEQSWGQVESSTTQADQGWGQVESSTAQADQGWGQVESSTTETNTWALKETSTTQSNDGWGQTESTTENNNRKQQDEAWRSENKATGDKRDGWGTAEVSHERRNNRSIPSEEKASSSWANSDLSKSDDSQITRDRNNSPNLHHQYNNRRGYRSNDYQSRSNDYQPRSNDYRSNNYRSNDYRSNDYRSNDYRSNDYRQRSNDYRQQANDYQKNKYRNDKQEGDGNKTAVAESQDWANESNPVTDNTTWSAPTRETNESWGEPITKINNDAWSAPARESADTWGVSPKEHITDNSWNAPTEKASSDGWDAPAENTANLGWNAPVEETASDVKDTPIKNKSNNNWGAPTEKKSNDGWDAPTEKKSNDGWDAPIEKKSNDGSDTATVQEPAVENTTVTVEPEVDNDGWGAPSKDVTGNGWDIEVTPSFEPVTTVPENSNLSASIEPIVEKKKENAPVDSVQWGSLPSAHDTNDNWSASQKNQPVADSWSTTTKSGWDTVEQQQATQNVVNDSWRAPQPTTRKSRGYLSQKIEDNVIEEPTKAEVVVEPPQEPVTESSWSVFRNHDDEDSDVEIILEAEEEHEWLKDEQVLGMTAPYDATKDSRAHKSNLNSYNSSPRSDVKKTNGRKPARRHFEENWRQRDDNKEEMYRPAMYYPPNAFVPMIPSANGNPMYAMPIPMGASPNTTGGSVSPQHGSDSSPHQKYYTSPPMTQLPPGYEANGMVYYGVDPNAIYQPQPYYYYVPMVNENESPIMYANDIRTSSAEDEGWGPSPDVSEEQWRSSPSNHDMNRNPHSMNYNTSYYYYPPQNPY